MIHPDAASLALCEFGRADLGHQARTKRAVRIAEFLFDHPNAPLSVEQDWSQAKLGYRFWRSSLVSHPALLTGHVLATAERCASHPVILDVQDTCEADFSSRKTTKGLSRIGDDRGRGLIFHTGLAVSADETHQVLGVLHQKAWTRPEQSRRSQKLTSKQRKKQPDLESHKWIEATQAAHCALAETHCRIIHVGDRESDIFELFEATDALQDSCVWRIKTDRCLSNEEVKRARSRKEPAVFPKLKTALVFAPVKARKNVQVPARKGQPARTAKVEIRAAALPIEPPQGRVPRGHALTFHLVWVYEIEAPPEAEPVCWYLLTREPIDTEEQVLFVVRCYEARWIIEEFHMGLKTGCGLEKRQLETAHALHNFLAFASVCSWHLLTLRDAARQPVPPAATEVLSATQLEVLYVLRPKLKREANAHEALRAVATLGGFLARKGDGEPGWRTLWLGFSKLLLAERGYLAALGRPASLLHKAAEGGS